MVPPAVLITTIYLEIIMTCQKCTITPTQVCRELNDLFDIYLRISEIHLVLERLEKDFQDRTPFMALNLNHVLGDMCEWLKRFEKRTVKDPLVLSELKKLGVISL